MPRQLFSAKGVNISTFIVDLFANQKKNKYPDETLAFLLAESFPNGPGERNYRRYIPMYRNRYNRGDFATQQCPPQEPALRYENGVPDPPRKGPKARLAAQKPKRRS